MSIEKGELILAASPGVLELRMVPMAAPKLSGKVRGGLFCKEMGGADWSVQWGGTDWTQSMEEALGEAARRFSSNDDPSDMEDPKDWSPNSAGRSSCCCLGELDC